MKSALKAMVLVTVLVMGSLGAISLGAVRPQGMDCGIGFCSDFNGGTPPSNPTGVPGDDPEHPK